MRTSSVRAIAVVFFLMGAQVSVDARVPAKEEMESFEAALAAEQREFTARYQKAAADPRIEERKKFEEAKKQQRLALQDSLRGLPLAEQSAALNAYAARSHQAELNFQKKLNSMKSNDRNNAINDFNAKAAKERRALLEVMPRLTPDEQARAVNAYNEGMSAERVKFEAKLDQTDPERMKKDFEQKRLAKIRSFYGDAE